MNDAQDGKPSDGKSAGRQLPVVWSPKLDAGEGMAEEFAAANQAASSSAEEAIKDTAGKSTDSSGAASSPSQPSRFMLLAASVAIAAAVGALAGSLSASGFSYFVPGSARARSRRRCKDVASGAGDQGGACRACHA